MDVEVRRVGTGAALADAHEIRERVFVEEQDVDPEIEYDDGDDDAVHLVAYADGEPVGTARLRTPEPGVGKVERVAVLAPHRGRGLGRRLVQALEDVAREEGLEEVHLHAQTTVEGFYADLGYETVSDVFMEADIPHVEMRKALVRDSWTC